MQNVLYAICFTFAGLFFGIVSGAYASQAAKKEGNREEGIGRGQQIYFIVNGLICFLTGLFLFTPATYIVLIILVGVLLFINKEGKYRAASWNSLLLLYSIMMVFSIARNWDKGGPKFQQLGYLVIPLIIYILGKIKVRFNERDIEEKPKKKEKDTAYVKASVIGWVVIAALAVIVVFAGALVLR